VKYYLSQLSAVCDEIICVTTSALSTDDIQQLKLYCSDVILRENVGHDFYSYKIGLASIQDLRRVDKLILCNDSCFGPLFELQNIYAKLINSSGDFWGISANSRPRLHLQSYFLIFSHQVVNSVAFNDFWQELEIISDKDSIVNNYEVGLSQCLLSAGFKLSSWLPINDYKIKSLPLLCRKWQIFIGERNNVNSRYSWKNLLEPLTRIDKTISLFDVSIKNYQLPFLKKSLFKDHWISNQQIIQIVEDNSNYDVELIKEALHD
jgi:rhamnosyltransferase